MYMYVYNKVSYTDNQNKQETSLDPAPKNRRPAWTQLQRTEDQPGPGSKEQNNSLDPAQKNRRPAWTYLVPKNRITAWTQFQGRFQGADDQPGSKEQCIYNNNIYIVYMYNACIIHVHHVAMYHTICVLIDWQWWRIWCVSATRHHPLPLSYLKTKKTKKKQNWHSDYIIVILDRWVASVKADLQQCHDKITY